MKRGLPRTTLASVVVAGAIASWSVPLFPQAQAPSAPGPQPVAAPVQPTPGREGAQGGPGQPGGRGGRGGRGGLGGPHENDPANATADYGPKPPVVPLTPAEEAKRFWLPPGFRMEPVLTDPDIEESAQIAFDGNGRMFVLELRGYMQDADASGELDPDRPHLACTRTATTTASTRRHSVFVDKLVFPRFVHAVRRERGPDDGVERRRGVEVHRHEQRRRRRQEGAVRDRLRPARERRAPAGRSVLGDGQLAVQHGQRRSALRWTPNGPCCSEPTGGERRASGARRRTTTARCGSRAARAACPATSSSRFTTATSAFPISSSRISTSPGARRC